MMRGNVRTALTALSMGLCATAAVAVENGLGPYWKGNTAFVPGTVEARSGVDTDDISGDDRAKQRPAAPMGDTERPVNIKLNVGLASAAFVADMKSCGDTCASAVDHIQINPDAGVVSPPGAEHAVRSNGEKPLEPVLLGRQESNVQWNTPVPTFAPSGNHPTDDPGAVRDMLLEGVEARIAHLAPTNSSDISTLFSYVSKNTANDYRAGDMVHIDWAAGTQLDPHWSIGVAGNIEQVGLDRAKFFRAESVGLGPAVTYNAEIGRFPVSVSARWESDLAPHSTLDDNVVSVLATILL